MSEPVVVQALYTFKGSNNDELFFRKGDLITITQKDDGGWWEGTLGDITGWFPVNYVREVKDVNLMQSIQPDVQNLSIVYKDLQDSERAHVNELQGLLTNFLLPLEKSTILTNDEYKQLTANFGEVLDTHQELVRLIDGEVQKPHREQRTGKTFLNYASRMKSVHQLYRSLHPKAVCIIDKYRDELSKYMESCGATCPGVLVLTTGLSKPFRRLAKYSGMLLEVERHVEDSHPDRGDIQRSVAVYKELEATCEAIRRQKEIELQILTGPVRGWEGQSLSSLGDIVYMGSVAVEPQHLDRYLVLFPTTLLILSISHRLSGFIYEGKLPVTGITVTKLDDGEQYKNAFEISGPLIEKVIAVCQSREEAKHWVEMLSKSNPNRYTSKPLPSKAEFVPQPPPHLNQRGYSNRMSVLQYHPVYDYLLTPPCPYYPPAAPYAGLSKLYAQMVKLKVINKKLLKMLIHPEIDKISIETLNVPRRQHRSECFLMRRGSLHRHSFVEASDSDSDSTGSRLEWKSSRQNAFDRVSSETGINSFGYIRYHNESSITPENVASEKVLRMQISEESDMSSNVIPNDACEDLTGLSENYVIHEEGKQCLPVDRFEYVPKMRASCPNKLVADKFNRNKNSLTTLNLIPQCNSESKVIRYQSAGSSSSSTTHSSTMDIPANILPVPDAILAELLYNPENLENMEMADDALIKPPTLFRNNSDNFRKHSIAGDDSSSLHSTDSGLAGSCTLNSPDFTPLHDALKLNSVLSEMYEEQCRCTSPFGSTPPRSSANLNHIPSPRSSIASIEMPILPSTDDDPATYRSGLYAHWWLKTDVPQAVLKGILEAATTGITKSGFSQKSLVAVTPTANRLNNNVQTSRSSIPAFAGGKGWSINCLRTTPPTRPCTSLFSNRAHAEKGFTYKDDALILEVVEAYFSANPRNTLNSAAVLRTGQDCWTRPMNANEQLKRLQQRLANIECNMESLANQLVEERAARIALQVIVRKYLPNNDPDLLVCNNAS